LQQWLDCRRQAARSRETIVNRENAPLPSKLADS
jgi:hypothetical protein